jgi:hypothetical protein
VLRASIRGVVDRFLLVIESIFRSVEFDLDYIILILSTLGKKEYTPRGVLGD